MAVIDLNTASVEQLQTLPEITADYARKIVAGRPYKERSDLERAGIPRDVASRIGPPAIIKSVGPPPPKGPRN
jgi:DNA uptake protein ComE-like DNA-binding protein